MKYLHKRLWGGICCPIKRLSMYTDNIDCLGSFEEECIKRAIDLHKMAMKNTIPCYLIYKSKKYNLNQMFKLTAAGITCGSEVDIISEDIDFQEEVIKFISTPNYS